MVPGVRIRRLADPPRGRADAGRHRRQRDDSVAEGEVNGVRRTRDLSSLLYDLELPPEDRFRLPAAPTLVLQSSEDLNVPVEGCLRVEVFPESQWSFIRYRSVHWRSWVSADQHDPFHYRAGVVDRILNDEAHD